MLSRRLSRRLVRRSAFTLYSLAFFLRLLALPLALPCPLGFCPLFLTSLGLISSACLFDRTYTFVLCAKLWFFARGSALHTHGPLRARNLRCSCSLPCDPAFPSSRPSAFSGMDWSFLCFYYDLPLWSRPPLSRLFPFSLRLWFAGLFYLVPTPPVPRACLLPPSLGFRAFCVFSSTDACNVMPVFLWRYLFPVISHVTALPTPRTLGSLCPVFWPFSFFGSCVFLGLDAVSPLRASSPSSASS